MTFKPAFSALTAASVAAGFLAGRFGPRRIALAASVALGVAWIAFGCASRWWDRTDVVFGYVHGFVFASSGFFNRCLNWGSVFDCKVVDANK